MSIAYTESELNDAADYTGSFTHYSDSDETMKTAMHNDRVRNALRSDTVWKHIMLVPNPTDNAHDFPFSIVIKQDGATWKDGEHMLINPTLSVWSHLHAAVKLKVIGHNFSQQNTHPKPSFYMGVDDEPLSKKVIHNLLYVLPLIAYLKFDVELSRAAMTNGYLPVPGSSGIRYVLRKSPSEIFDSLKLADPLEVSFAGSKKSKKGHYGWNVEFACDEQLEAVMKPHPNFHRSDGSLGVPMTYDTHSSLTIMIGCWYKRSVNKMISNIFYPSLVGVNFYGDPVDKKARSEEFKKKVEAQREAKQESIASASTDDAMRIEM